MNIILYIPVFVIYLSDMEDICRMIDDIDIKILNHIQNNPKASNASIGKKIGMTPSAIFERIRKLEVRGVIKGYNTELNPKVLGLGVLAFVFLKVEIGADQSKIEDHLNEVPEIQEAHHIAGEDCYMIKIWALNTDDLGRLLLDKIHPIMGIKETRTTIVLKTVKQASRLPLERHKEAGG